MIDFTPGLSLSWGPPQLPERVLHARRPLAWRVEEVLETWTHPRYLQEGHEQLGECCRYRMRVWGPMPWRPGERGEFVLVARRYGNRLGWWISPG